MYPATASAVAESPKLHQFIHLASALKVPVTMQARTVSTASPELPRPPRPSDSGLPPPSPILNGA